MHIQRLDLYSHIPEKLLAFYERLGFSCTTKKKRVSLQVGSTQLNFTRSEDQSYYHFAFNIPANRLEACHDWLQELTDLLPFQGSTVVDFPGWKAQSVYALDPANNIIEFIARQDIGDRGSGPFSVSTDVLNVCEIGCPVPAIEQFTQVLAPAAVPTYSGGLKRFCALGDPHGLFIVIDPEKVHWLPTELSTLPFPFQVIFEQNKKQYTLQFAPDHLQLTLQT